MPTWDQGVQFLNTFGVPVTLLVFIGIFFWKYGARYIASVEKLHDAIGTTIGKQQHLCEDHGKVMNAHDADSRRAVLEACSFCRRFVEREFPNSAKEADDACDKIEKIIGEA